jgi:hypothetical protein
MGVAERLAAAIARVGNPDGESREEADQERPAGAPIPILDVAFGSRAALPSALVPRPLYPR